MAIPENITYEEQAYLHQIRELIYQIVHLEGGAIRVSAERDEQFQRVVEANEELSSRVIYLAEELDKYTADVAIDEDDEDGNADSMGEWPDIETK